MEPNLQIKNKTTLYCVIFCLFICISFVLFDLQRLYLQFSFISLSASGSPSSFALLKAVHASAFFS